MGDFILARMVYSGTFTINLHFVNPVEDSHFEGSLRAGYENQGDGEIFLQLVGDKTTS
jgi:hypothetical protein